MITNTNFPVVITVAGGVAEVAACPEGVDVQVIDYDNLEAELEALDVDDKDGVLNAIDEAVGRWHRAGGYRNGYRFPYVYLDGLTYRLVEDETLQGAQ